MLVLLRIYVVGPIQTNCYVVGDEETREVLVIDPGDSGPELLEALATDHLQVTHVFSTHHHVDHTAALHEVLTGAPEAQFAMSGLDYPLIAEFAPLAQQWYGREVTPPRAPDIDLQHGDVLRIGRREFTALHCPGHTPGSICLVGDGVAFTGDVLFQGSIGRSDLPGGDGRQLLESIHAQLLPLPDDTAVFPGHGPQSTIGAERTQNPFLQLPPDQMALRFG